MNANRGREPALTCTPDCCPTKPPLESRPLLNLVQAGGLAGLFKVLANDTRLRLLHALVRAGELSVTDLSRALGMKPQAVSNQLQRLLDSAVLACRREGAAVLYRVADPCVTALLDKGLCLLEEPRAASCSDCSP
jgi:DNA-binding transcriptional ArsR family regulator